jgi:hypothetical protein
VTRETRFYVFSLKKRELVGRHCTTLKTPDLTPEMCEKRWEAYSRALKRPQPMVEYG